MKKTLLHIGLVSVILFVTGCESESNIDSKTKNDEKIKVIKKVNTSISGINCKHVRKGANIVGSGKDGGMNLWMGNIIFNAPEALGAFNFSDKQINGVIDFSLNTNCTLSNLNLFFKKFENEKDTEKWNKELVNTASLFIVEKVKHLEKIGSQNMSK